MTTYLLILLAALVMLICYDKLLADHAEADRVDRILGRGKAGR